MTRSVARSRRHGPLSLAFAAWSICCEPSPANSTGGTDVSEVFGADGRSCGRGITVSMTDYESSNVALISLDGSVLSSRFISSGSTDTRLSAPLVEAVFPSGKMQREIVVLDRFPASVLTFVDPASARVKSQISLRTGFDANPQDFLDLGDGRALVSRLEKNPTPGREPFDGGDDILWLDLDESSVVGRIDLSQVTDSETGRARPSRMVRAGDTVFVSLTGHDATFRQAAIGRVLALDAESGAIVGVHEIAETKNCVGLALSPSGNELAVACSDLINEANASAPPHSAIVTLSFSREGDEVAWQEAFRIHASALSWGPFTDSIAYADEDLLVVGLYGALEGEDAGRPDRIVSLSPSTGETGVLLESGGEPFTLGDIRCVEPCGVCFVADAGRGVIHRFGVGEGELSEPTAHVIESDIGLPPRGLGHF